MHPTRNSGDTAARTPISCFVVAKDEADRIGRTIESVRDWLSEVIVIDGGSTDGTAEIADELGAKVLFRAWDGYGLQKRYGEECCRFNWLLNLDADEVVTPELRDAILALFAGGSRPLPPTDYQLWRSIQDARHLGRFATSIGWCGSMIAAGCAIRQARFTTESLLVERG